MWCTMFIIFLAKKMHSVFFNFVEKKGAQYLTIWMVVHPFYERLHVMSNSVLVSLIPLDFTKRDSLDHMYERVPFFK